MNESIAARFQKLDTDRQVALSRKREHARMTMPSLLPPSGHTVHTLLDVPYSSVPAEGISSLASRITSMVWPSNGQAVFEGTLNQPFAPEGRDDSELDASFQRFERAVMNTLAPTNLRAATFLSYQHEVAVGDSLMFMDDDLEFRVFRADQFVVRRKHEGDWQEILIVEAVLPEWEPDLKLEPTSGPVRSPQYTSFPSSPQGEKWEYLYTSVVRDPEDVSVTVKQEHREKLVGEKKFLTSPYFPGRWGAIAGEPYGISLVESIFGDIRALSMLNKSLYDLSALVAEHRWGVNPAGLTEIQDVLDSVNGGAIASAPGDIFPLQFSSSQALSALFATVQHREQLVGRRFLMNSAVQPSGERVTARQVSILAQELEGMLGGVLSIAARDKQEPIIRRVISVMADKGQIPDNIRDEILDPKGFVKLRIRAGLEILNREAQREKLDTMVANMRNLPEAAFAAVNWTELLRDWWQSQGLEDTGVIKSEQQMAQEAQQAQQAAMQQQAQQAALGVAAQRATQPTE